jgi:ribosomal protein S18 acetylase RimI-like enzyme
MASPDSPAIRSLVYATDIDVLAQNKLLTRRDGYWRIESPGNPTFWWGNLLLFDKPPAAGDRERWERTFDREFAAVCGIRHKVFAWDSPEGDHGAAATEFTKPYVVEQSIGLVAAGDGIRPHRRANSELEVRMLDPRAGYDEDLWQAVLELQLAQMLSEPWAAELGDAYTGVYRKRRNTELREIFRAGRGAWYVALLDGEVAGSLGIVVTDGRARYQSVDTAARFRGRGVATRLVVEAAAMASAQQPIDHYVIVADPDYHALGIYESVGFKRSQRAVGVMLAPGA